MVKTRRQQQLPPLVLQLQPAQKRKRALVARPSISRQQMRQRVARRMRGEEKQPKGTGKVDFSSEEYIDIARPEKFHCPVCLELMIHPVLTHCGHAFCLPCLEEALKHKSACSLCRKDLDYSSFSESKLIRDIVQRIASRLREEEEEEFQKRRTAFKEKDAKRCVDEDIEVGDLVDFFMEGMWHEGSIIGITNGQEKEYEVEAVHKQRLKAKLKHSSRLLAKHRFFSKQNTLFRHYMGQFSFQQPMRPSIFVSPVSIQDSFSFFDFQLNQISLLPQSGIDEIRFVLSIQHS